MDVLIVSKTRMRRGVCVGGIEITTGRFVRLLDRNGNPPGEHIGYGIRQIWEITYKDPTIARSLPHCEDICVLSQACKSTLSNKTTMLDFITSRGIDVYRGNIFQLFESKLKCTNSGSFYINQEAVPQNSVCFWIADRNLSRDVFTDGKVKYRYEDETRYWGYSIPYVGFEETVDTILSGRLLRMSLASWWAHEGEQKCFLQLSGWYD